MLNREIIAYIHIEKAAGQTIQYILQNNFLCKHCQVKTLKKSEKGVFSSSSMGILLRINPFIKSISGHSIMPFSDLKKKYPNIKYITLMREPFDRYISHYQYQVNRMRSSWTFDNFLKQNFTKNFQTKKIAGTENLDKAIKIINEDIFLVGTVDEFDKFLLVLQKKLLPEKLTINYESKNVATDNRIKNDILKNIAKYKIKIEENNYLDIKLYDYVKNIIFKKEKEKYLQSTNYDTEKITINDTIYTNLNFLLFRIYRKIYYDQVIKIVRKYNKMPVRGAY